MQSFFTVRYIAKALSLTEQGVLDAMNAMEQTPAMSIDNQLHFSQSSVEVLKTELAREDRIRQLEKHLGYAELNDIVYPNKNGACGHFGPLERFIDQYGERPGPAAVDYWAEVEAYKNAVQGN